LPPPSPAGAGACRAHQEGNALPTRVVDPGPHRDERLDARRGRDQFLVAICGHLLPLDHSGHVLAAHELVGGERAHCREQLRLAVANVLGGEGIGRLHRHECEHLEQMVLDHVAQRACLLVVAPSAADAVRLGDSDLNVIDRLAAPRPLDHRVGEPEDQDVLYRLLAHVMVDAKRLVEHPAHDPSVLPGARQVAPDRLLKHDTCAGRKAVVPDSLDDRRESRGRIGAVEEPPTLGAELGVERLKSLG
jgi:hypothetical protein